MKEIKIYTLNNDDMNNEYGNHLRHNVGDCFKTKDGHHYYKQLQLNILHICDDDLINITHNSVTDNKNLIKISDQDFENMLRITIFNLEIYKYCIPTDYTKN
jgi:hypothetical protein